LCTKILADLGADVIKVEPGNASRYRGPFYHEQADPEKSLLFWYVHTNKRSVTLDLETPTGQALLHRLLATADALVETFPPGYLDSLGLSCRHLRACHPRLVTTSITGFGSTGPIVIKAPDIVGLAMGGLPNHAANRTVHRHHLAVAGLSSGGAQWGRGDTIALWHREATGQGQHVDVDAGRGG
jgi:crotonobetainyl-CoA:carnitine CoA-transferase CaiB-like acyl-CoA transferase